MLSYILTCIGLNKHQARETWLKPGHDTCVRVHGLTEELRQGYMSAHAVGSSI